MYNLKQGKGDIMRDRLYEEIAQNASKRQQIHIAVHYKRGSGDAFSIVFGCGESHIYKGCCPEVDVEFDADNRNSSISSVSELCNKLSQPSGRRDSTGIGVVSAPTRCCSS